jgi:hypothetical protein
MSTTLETKVMSRNFMVNVAKLGIESDLSYRGVARIANVSDSTVRRIDRLRRQRLSYQPRQQTVMKFANAIGCHAGDLLME